MASTQTPFEKLTPIHPNRRITLETGATPIAPRLMDLLVPLGFGERALMSHRPRLERRRICANWQPLYARTTLKPTYSFAWWMSAPKR